MCVKYTKYHQQHGIDRRAFTILRALYKCSEPVPLRVLASRVSDIPRTSIALRLRSLQSRGLVQSVGGIRTLRWSLTGTGTQLLYGSNNQPEQQSVDFKAYWHGLIPRLKGKRVKLLNSFTNEQNITSTFPEAELTQLFLALEHNQIVFDGVMPESSKHLRKQFSSPIQESMDRRPSVWYVCKDELLTLPDSFIVYDDTVVIYNFHEGRVLPITDESFAVSMKQIIRHYQSLGVRV